jgi:hypothetical protein
VAIWCTIGLLVLVNFCNKVDCKTAWAIASRLEEIDAIRNSEVYTSLWRYENLLFMYILVSARTTASGEGTKSHPNLTPPSRVRGSEDLGRFFCIYVDGGAFLVRSSPSINYVSVGHWGVSILVNQTYFQASLFIFPPVLFFLSISYNCHWFL